MKYRLLENLVLQKWAEKNLLVVQSDLGDKKSRGTETFKHKDTLKHAGFRWNSNIMAWTIDINKFNDAKKAINDVNKNELLKIIDDLKEFVLDDVDDKQSEKSKLFKQLDEYAQKLADDIADPEKQQEYIKYINFKSKFYNYSDFNVFLIWIFKRDATHVASYNTWRKEFKRQVKKGAKGAPIFVPIRFKYKVADEEQDALTNKDVDDSVKNKREGLTFKIGYVFDISDTEPMEGAEEVPTLDWHGNGEPDEKADALFDKLSEFVDEYGVPVVLSPSRHGEQGWTDGKTIHINDKGLGLDRFRVLIHEFAHFILHFDKSMFDDLYQEVLKKAKLDGIDGFDELMGNKSLSRLKELHADGVTYMVLSHYGFDTKFNINYLLSWKSNKDMIKLNEKILKTGAAFIINGIKKQ